MKRFFKVLIWALLWGLGCATALASDLVSKREIFEDPTGQMDLFQVKGMAFDAAPELVYKGFSRSVFWIRLHVNVPSHPEMLSLRVRPNLLDMATLYYPSPSPAGEELVLPMNTRAAQKETNLLLQTGQQTLYLRVASDGALLIKSQLLTEHEARLQDQAEQMELGAVLAVYAMAFAIMVGLVWMRRMTLLYFLAFHLAICLLQYLLVFDLMSQIAPWAWAHGKNASRLITVVNFFSFTVFMQAFLAQAGLVHLQRWARYASFVLGLLVVLFFVIDKHQVLKITVAAAPLITLSLLCTLLYFQWYFSRNRKLHFTLRLTSAMIVIGFTAIVGRAMLQILGVLEPGAFLLQSPAWRGIFLPLFLMGFLWNRDHEQMKALRQTQIDNAVAKVLAQDQAQRLSTQSQFMAMLMHELKTPLYIIQVATTSLSRHMADSHPDAKRLDNIARAADDINFIIDRCVQADKLDQSDLTVHKTPVSLKTLLSEVKHIKGHERVAFTGIDQAKVATDYQYARIILINLVTNALKYSPPGSPVQLSVQEATLMNEQGLTLRVTNAIASAGRPDPDKVFTRYYRAEGAKKEVGAGLGLWLANSLAIKLGSELRCSGDDGLVHFDFSLELS